MTDQSQLFRFPYWRRVLSVAGDALIGYWPLWEPSDVVAFDLAGYQRNAAYTAVTLNQPGMGDGSACPSFDGSTSFCNIYSAGFAAAFNNQEVTVLAWCKMPSAALTDGVTRRALNIGADSNNVVRISKPNTNNNLSVSYVAGGTNKVVTKASVTTTDWFHIGLTASKSADQVKMYYNGIQDGSTLTALGVWAGALASTLTVIGAGSTVPAAPWNGWIVHLGVWARALSAAEVAELYRVN